MPEDQSLSTLPDITETTAATAPTTEPSSNGEGNKATKTRKRKAEKNLTISQFTITTPTYAYLHLQHLTPASLSATLPVAAAQSLDATTALLDLRASASQFLGLHGAAIPIDILKLQDRDVWIRIPNGDRHALVAAIGGWVGKNGQGWRVKGWSSWSVSSCDSESSGQGLFVND